MAKLNLTKKTLDALNCFSGRADYFDSHLPGLCFRVTASGAKSFSVVYRHGGRLRRYTIGAYPTFSLADARDEALKALRDAALGVDPATRRETDRQGDTFEVLAADFMERWSKKQKKSWREDQWMINHYLLPRFKNVLAKNIRRSDIRAMVEAIAETGPTSANRVLALTRKIFNWAISQDLLVVNPCNQIQKPGLERRRDRVLSEEEIQRIWQAFEKEDALMSSLFKLRLLTAQRGGEVAGLRWDELDLKNAWWTIPAERSKNGMPHRVPLSAPAVDILESLKQQQSKLQNETKLKSPFVFYAPRGEGHIEELQKAVQRMRLNTMRHKEDKPVADFRAHDLRRTAASTMTSMGIPRLVVGRILNHAETGVTAVYDRHSYDPEKREALDAWANRLMAIVSGMHDE